jgi:hypothetical protein
LNEIDLDEYLQSRLIEVGDSQVEVGGPHLTVDGDVINVAERHLDKTVRKLLKALKKN